MTTSFGVAESVYETISESIEALSKIQRNHSAIQQRPLLLIKQDSNLTNHGARATKNRRDGGKNLFLEWAVAGVNRQIQHDL